LILFSYSNLLGASNLISDLTIGFYRHPQGRLRRPKDLFLSKGRVLRLKTQDDRSRGGLKTTLKKTI